MGLRLRRTDQRTLAEHGDVPVRLVEMFIDLSQAQIRHTREKTCEARFFIASELIGFVRLASLR